ncbi:hypothetical protein CO046_01395 [Candidatus Peregrinibacteria bacterium CG_4_9_14_0_2_um_filter_53_11]|nr:MAG: hypothetical protein CO046_01395 [Candidatus Peregrinibacteria bacterium CG_4_9_14_0_2_um_filter_53_11]
MELVIAAAAAYLLFSIFKKQAQVMRTKRAVELTTHHAGETDEQPLFVDRATPADNPLVVEPLPPLSQVSSKEEQEVELAVEETSEELNARTPEDSGEIPPIDSTETTESAEISHEAELAPDNGSSPKEETTEAKSSEPTSEEPENKNPVGRERRARHLLKKKTPAPLPEGEATQEAPAQKPPTRADLLNYYEINKAFRTGDKQFAQGNFAEAEKWFIKALSYHEFHAESLNRLGVIYITQGNHKRAELLYKKLFSTNQKEPTYFANYGRCLYSLGRHTEALESYQRAIELDGNKPSRFISVGQIYYEMEEFAMALAAFQRALALDSYNPEYLTLVAELAERTDDMMLNYKTLKKMAEINPYDKDIQRRFKRALAIKRGEIPPEEPQPEVAEALNEEATA